jgi:hypothetical protein
MSWMTTWPSKTGPNGYREHATEAAAEAHANEPVRRKEAAVAVVFEIDDMEEAS